MPQIEDPAIDCTQDSVCAIIRGKDLHASTLEEGQLLQAASSTSKDADMGTGLISPR